MNAILNCNLRNPKSRDCNFSLEFKTTYIFIEALTMTTIFQIYLLKL